VEDLFWLLYSSMLSGGGDGGGVIRMPFGLILHVFIGYDICCCFTEAIVLLYYHYFVSYIIISFI